MAVEMTAPAPIFASIPRMAALLEMSDNTFRRHVRAGAVPTYVIGGLVRVKVAEVVAWVESKQREAG